MVHLRITSFPLHWFPGAAGTSAETVSSCHDFTSLNVSGLQIKTGVDLVAFGLDGLRVKFDQRVAFLT